MDYSEYKHLAFQRFDDGVLQVTLNRPEVLNATDARMHWEIARVWKDIDADAQAKVVLVTGAGRAFSVGGDNNMLAQTLGDAEQIAGLWREAGDIVYNMINLDKPIISAINGPAFGAGLAVALLADISIVAENVRFTDGHVILGVAAGDHAVIIWPLLCGMAKAKYYLLTGELLDGKEAERIGLVSLCVPAAQLMDKALETAHKLAAGPQQALRWTSARSTTGCGWRGRASTPRWRWKCWVSFPPISRRATRRSRNGVRPSLGRVDVRRRSEFGADLNSQR